ncbi:MAG: hypothetical protein M3R02_15870 [Chloroflexota bacterium]|nr:hypothetical protein [Chloroflexota bacterium]
MSKPSGLGSARVLFVATWVVLIVILVVLQRLFGNEVDAFGYVVLMVSAGIVAGSLSG